MRLAGVLLVVGACSSPPMSPSPMCDGLDHDGDGVVDDVCACTPFDVTFPSNVLTTELTWTGNAYIALVGATSPDESLIRVDAQGNVGQPFGMVPATPLSVDAGPRIVWSGSSVGVLVSTNSAFTLDRYDPTGTLLGSTPIAPVTDGRPALSPSLIWAGDRFLVGWTDPTVNAPSTEWIVEVSANGTLGTPIELHTQAQGEQLDSRPRHRVSASWPT